MEYRKLEKKPQFANFLAAQKKFDDVAQQNQQTPTVEYVTALIELLRIMDLCADLIADEDMKSMFGRYIT